MKRIIIWLLAAAILLSSPVSTYAAPNDSKDKKTAEATTTAKDKYGLSITAKTAILMDAKTGTVLYEKKSNKKMYPASITKVMTTMLTLENCEFDEIVTFSDEAIFGTEAGSSGISTEVGEKLTVEQCLYAMMLESANEVCAGIAEHITGTKADFVKLMNKRAKELGCKNTHFANPNGLPDDKHYTTAYDMALITQEALKYPMFRKVTSTIHYVIPKTNKKVKRNLWQHNKMTKYSNASYSFDGYEGGKTGYTVKAGNTLVSFAKRGDLELICVVLKSAGIAAYHDTKTLLEYGYSHYQQISPAKDFVLGSEKTDNPVIANLYSLVQPPNLHTYVDEDFSILVSNKVNPKKITKTINLNLDPSAKTLGTLDFSYKGKKIGSTPIHYTDDIKISNLSISRQTFSLQNIPKEIWAIAAAGLVIVIILIALIVKLILWARRRRIRFGRRRRRYWGK